MNKYLFIIFIIFVNINAFSEGIVGKWYRNYLFAEAELTINENMDFSITATHTAHEGEIEGKLVKIKDGYYFSHIEDPYPNGQRCVVILVEKINHLEIIIYGDQVNAGARVYYDGEYNRQPTSNEKKINMAIDYIIENNYDGDVIKILLGNDIQYFIECFGTRHITNKSNVVIIEGWMPGVAPWQNGIIKIDDNKIYILITDCRGENIIFRYYSNDSSQKNIPNEFINWQYFNKDIIIK